VHILAASASEADHFLGLQQHALAAVGQCDSVVAEDLEREIHDHFGIGDAQVSYQRDDVVVVFQAACCHLHREQEPRGGEPHVQAADLEGAEEPVDVSVARRDPRPIAMAVPPMM
jgi:hypothetical protein